MQEVTLKSTAKAWRSCPRLCGSCSRDFGVCVLQPSDASHCQPGQNCCVECSLSAESSSFQFVECMRTEKATHPSLVGYTSAISRQQWQKALELLSELRGFALQANVITFTAVIGTCARAGQWQQAAGIFGNLQAESLQPTLVTYNSGISACHRAVQWRSAIDYLSAAKITKPDKITYSSAMSSCGRCQRWREGFGLFREARVDVEMDVVVYGSAMAVIASMAEWRRSLVLLRQMLEQSVTLCPTSGVSCFSHTLSGLFWAR